MRLVRSVGILLRGARRLGRAGPGPARTVRALGCALLALAAGLYRGKRYTATGEVQIQPGSASDLKQSISSALLGGGGSLDIVMESDIRILDSDKLLLSVAKKQNLATNPEFYGQGSGSFLRRRSAAPLNGNLDDPILRATAAIARRKAGGASRAGENARHRAGE